MDSSSKTTTTNLTSKYQNVLAKLDRIDKAISGFLFRLSLPTIVEAIYSVPANFFGLVPSVAVGPLLIALLALEDGVATEERSTFFEFKRQHSNIVLLKSTTLLLFAIFLVAWALFQKGYMPLTKVLVKKPFYLLSIIFNVGMLSYTLLRLPSDDPYAAASEKAYSLSIYLLFLWSPSLLIIVILKKICRRVRPIVLDMAGDDGKGSWLNKKAFPNICHYLRKSQSSESFPSGDATSAAIFAIVLVNISPRYTIPAWSILALACTGRMYVLAHHFLDVVAGSILAIIIHRCASAIGLGIYDMQWWHPFASTIFLAIYVKTMMKKKKE